MLTLWKAWVGLVFAVVVSTIACGSRLPEPPLSPIAPAGFVEIPYPPPPARAEFLPPRPRPDAVWVDGEWDWSGRRFAWTYGAWVVSPPGATRARWFTARRSDGALFFAPSVWRDEHGKEIEPPPPLAVAGGAPAPP